MNFDFTNDQPIYLQLVAQLKILIISGKISPGEFLPSVRDLALQAKINPNTVQRALSMLESEGLIITDRTNGKYVTTDTTLIEKARSAFATEKTLAYFTEMLALGFSRTEILVFLEDNHPNDPLELT